MPKPSHPPFTRLPVDPGQHPTVQRAVTDIYDKLQAVTQWIQAQPPAAHAVAAGASGPVVRYVTTTTQIRPGDQTIDVLNKAASSIVLPPADSLKGLGPFGIVNSKQSSGNVTFASANSELLNGVQPTTISILPGHSMEVQPESGRWVTVAQF